MANNAGEFSQMEEEPAPQQIETGGPLGEMKGLADEDYKEAGSSSAPTKGKSSFELTI